MLQSAQRLDRGDRSLVIGHNVPVPAHAKIKPRHEGANPTAFQSFPCRSWNTDEKPRGVTRGARLTVVYDAITDEERGLPGNPKPGLCWP